MPDMNMQTFEELQRHQLVTEFDIQSQSDLEDYQIKLDNVNNPTQAQDNLVVGIDGDALPHWNESLDFDTWVKMQIGLSGRRGLLIHGNSGLSSGSSIGDTFVDGSEFDDLTGWTQQAGTWTADGKLHSPVVDAGSWGVLKRTSPLPVNDDYIISTRLYMENVANSRFIMLANAPTPLPTSWDNTMQGPYMSASGNVIGVDGNIAGSTSQTISVETWYLNEYYYKSSGINTIKHKLYSNDGTYLNAHTINGNADHTGYYFGFAASYSDYDVDWWHVRKYTTTEPTYTIGTPKNISTALKSFGRAG